MKENSIIVIETEPVRPLRVNRLRITGANRFGGPEVEDVGEQEFTSLFDAYTWSSETPEYSHHFSMELPTLDLRAQLTGPRGDGSETLAVNSNGKVGISPRAKENHHAVSTDRESFFNLVIYLNHSQSYIFDRGVVWVKVPRMTEPPVLSFTINAGIHTPKEMENETLKMFARVGKVLSDLVEGEEI